MNRVAPAAELRGGDREARRRLLRRGPLALGIALESVLRGSETGLDEGLRIEADLFGIISSTKDMREGLTAFLEKRKPGYDAARLSRPGRQGARPSVLPVPAIPRIMSIDPARLAALPSAPRSRSGWMPGKRVLFLTKDPELIRRQLARRARPADGGPARSRTCSTTSTPTR